MKQFFKVQVLYIIVLAAPMVLGQGSTATTCQNVNTHLTALTAAFNALCNVNTSPAQSCNCSVEWESISMTQIGTINVRSTNTQSFIIPNTVPSTAREVLVYVYVIKGYSQEYFSQMKIYTESSPTRRFEKYLPIKTYHQDAYSTTSENMFFPMPSNRRVYIRLTNTHPENVHGYVNIIGYR